MKNRLATVLLIVAALMLVVSNRFAPIPALAQSPRSLDDELLDDLGADPLDDVDRELFGPGDRQDGPNVSPGEADQDLPGRLRRELGTAAVSEDENPLLEIARRMREVQDRIDQHDSGPTTRNLQEQIVADLDRLIEDARRRCRQSKPGSTQPQQTAARQSPGQLQPNQGDGPQDPGTGPATTAAAGPADGSPARQTDMAQMQEVMKRLWGQLPARQREQMIQSSPEEFLPKYELLIEEYYRRLSEARQRNDE